MKNEVIRDPSVKNNGRNGHPDSFIVVFNDRICTPNFNSLGAAKAYLDGLEAGTRKPEYPAD